MMFTSKKLDSGCISQVVDIHDRAFKNFFLTTLGKAFLKQFYLSLAERSDVIARGYWDKQMQLVGFFVANYNHQGFYKRLCKQNFFRFFLPTFKVFLSRPRLLVRLANSLSTSSRSHGFEKYPYLMSICVDPAVQNKGLGKEMILDLMEILRQEGYDGLYLTTDAHENNSTNSFYIRAGFVKNESFLQGKRLMNLYFRNLSPQ
jgi:ribosomal protein S18 acetylase RimI-like enzyme